MILSPFKLNDQRNYLDILREYLLKHDYLHDPLYNNPVYLVEFTPKHFPLLINFLK
jgi:hypothetical protein